MTNRIDLALVNQWRAARFDPCSNTGAIDSQSGRHPSASCKALALKDLDRAFCNKKPLLCRSTALAGCDHTARSGAARGAGGGEEPCPGRDDPSAAASD